MNGESNYQTINEDIRQQFESAWAAGNPQPIEAVAGDPTSENYLATLEELVHIELEYLWKKRDPLKRPALESYLERFELLRDPEILSRLVSQEIGIRRSVGEAPSTVEYQERFPGVRIEIPGMDQAEQETGILNEDDIETHREMPTLAPGDLEEGPDLDSATMVDQQSRQKKVILDGDFVPGYDLLGELGRGGMGVVYQARDQKLKRVVALKMILSGVHASEEDMQRFQVEAEAVARLQHANIVQIYEVGEHKGNPYISLEYQEGGSLDKKIAGTPQNLEESAKLVETLARAMQAAHAQGIIHRDLKPANILLAADGQPKITDFGLAKRMDEDSNQTKSGAVMGTPSYMAPEQAASSKESLGPAADTYALGAILYHLITGRPPFRAETQLDTLLQVISDEPLTPRRLNNKIPIDLETICLKCLQKDIGRRYRSAEELAEDLRRVLAGEPISARPVTGLERTWKWARRRPAVAGLIVLSVVATIGIVASGISYNRLLKGSLQQAESLREEEQQQRKLAEEGRKRAEENLFMAAQLVEKYLTELSENELMNVPKMEGLRRELLEEALAYYERFVEQDSDDVLMQKKLASAHNNLGTVLHDLGENSRSIEQLKKAVAIWKAIRVEYPYDAGVTNSLAASESALGSVYRRTGEFEKAEALFNDAIDHSSSRLGLAKIYNELGSLLSEKGNHSIAERWLTEAVRLYGQELVRPSSYPETNEQEVVKGLAGANANLGWSLARLEKRAEAREAYERAIKGYKQLLQLVPESMEGAHGLAESLTACFGIVDDSESGKKMLSEANEIMVRLVAEHPDIREFSFTLGVVYWLEGTALANGKEKGDIPKEVSELYGRSLEIQEKLVKEQQDVPKYATILAETYESYATVLNRMGEEEASGKYLNKAFEKYLKNVELGERLVKKAPGDVVKAGFLLETYNELGQLWHRANNVEQEIKIYRRAIVFFEPMVAPIRIKYAQQLAGFEFRAAIKDYSKVKFLLELAQFHEKLGDLFTGTENYFAAAFHYRGAAGIHVDWPKTLKSKFKEHQGVVKSRQTAQSYTDTLKFVEEYVEIEGASDLVYFAAAGMYAFASELAAADQTIGGVERGVRTDQYARRSIELLEAADRHNFFKLTSRLDDLRKDELFTSLRQRDDYKELVAKLEKALE